MPTECALECGEFTEGGDDICPTCRSRLGEDRNRIDDAIHYRTYIRSLRLTRDGIIAALTPKRKPEPAHDGDAYGGRFLDIPS